jgi:hypothetical protein
MLKDLDSPEEYEEIGRMMTLKRIMEFKRPSDNNPITQFAFEYSTYHILTGFIKKESVPMEDKILAFLHVSAIIDWKCSGANDAQRQIEAVLNEENQERDPVL